MVFAWWKKWDEFKIRYFKELENNSESVNMILNKVKKGPITLVYGTRDEKFNNAIALKEYLEEKSKGLRVIKNKQQ